MVIFPFRLCWTSNEAEGEDVHTPQFNYFIFELNAAGGESRGDHVRMVSGEKGQDAKTIDQCATGHTYVHSASLARDSALMMMYSFMSSDVG